MSEFCTETPVPPPATLPTFLLDALNFIAVSNVNVPMQVRWRLERWYCTFARDVFDREMKCHGSIRRALVKALLRAVTVRHGFLPTVENARLLDAAIRTKKVRMTENPSSAPAQFGVRAAPLRSLDGEPGDAGWSSVERKPRPMLRSNPPASLTINS